MGQSQSAPVSASPASPDWGSLPVEQYILRNWDTTSPLPIPAQRQQLVRAFIQADSVTVPDAERLMPSESQIRTILAPWRPQKLRRIAQKHVESGPEGEFYFLRTHYAGGAADDARLRAWLDMDEEEFIVLPAEDEWWVVLDDAELFDLGDDEADWQRVYDVFPELVAPRLERSIVEDGCNLYYIRNHLKWLVPEGEPREEDWAEAVRFNVHIRGTRLLVVDRKAFETDAMGLVFRDVKGNVVREGRVRADELMLLDIYQNVRGSLCEQHFWRDSEVGEKYRVGGEVVRELVPLAKAGDRAGDMGDIVAEVSALTVSGSVH